MLAKFFIVLVGLFLVNNVFSFERVTIPLGGGASEVSISIKLKVLGLLKFQPSLASHTPTSWQLLNPVFLK